MKKNFVVFFNDKNCRLIIVDTDLKNYEDVKNKKKKQKDRKKISLFEGLSLVSVCLTLLIKIVFSFQILLYLIINLVIFIHSVLTQIL